MEGERGVIVPITIILIYITVIRLFHDSYVKSSFDVPLCLKNS